MDAKLNGIANPLDFGTDAKGKVLPLVSYESLDLSTTFSGINSNVENEKLESLRALFTEKENGGKIYKITTTPMELERGVARVDFKDREATVRGTLPAYCYKVGGSTAIVKLVGMKLLNVGSESYLFRHTATGTDEKATGDLALFGKEYGNSGYTWIASPDWTKGTNEYTISRSSSTSSSITTDVLETHPTISAAGSFKPWCYIYENTLPSTDYMKNLEANATGIEFKFQIMNSDGSAALPADITSAQKVPGAITQGSEKNKITVTMPDGKNQTLEYTDGYYFTYTGYLKHHNPEGKDGVTNIAPMQYGIVRNNVYQVTVSGVNGLPNMSNAADMYLELDVKVRNWQKRANDFTFGEE